MAVTSYSSSQEALVAPIVSRAADTLLLLPKPWLQLPSSLNLTTAELGSCLRARAPHSSAVLKQHVIPEYPQILRHRYQGTGM